jgi:hypothetical protein
MQRYEDIQTTIYEIFIPRKPSAWTLFMTGFSVGFGTYIIEGDAELDEGISQNGHGGWSG